MQPHTLDPQLLRHCITVFYRFLKSSDFMIFGKRSASKLSGFSPKRQHEGGVVYEKTLLFSCSL